MVTLRTRSSDLLRVQTAAAILLAAAFLSPPAIAADEAVPDFSGYWARLTFGFELPESGPGPLRPLTGFDGRPGGGGDYTNPILTPLGAAAVKERSEIMRRGEDYPLPSSRCLPMASPYIFRVQEVQILQKKDEVVFLFMQDHQVRRVRLNAQHPAHVIPSWSGDSIGHYEGDTLVVDTIGFKLGPLPIVDELSGAPFSAALHVVERYRLVDYEAARAAQEKNIRDSGSVITEQAAFVDENYTGKGLQVQFTVEDKNVFNTPWGGAATYRRAGGWVENVCAENTHEYYNNGFTKVPEAEKPDF
jgi:hypothetical protein